MIEGAGDADTEACPIATSTKDASGALPSIRPTADMATYTDDGSGRAAFTYDIEDMTGHAAPTMGAPDMPSFAFSPMDADIDCASSVDALAALTPLTLITGVAPAGSWCV